MEWIRRSVEVKDRWMSGEASAFCSWQQAARNSAKSSRGEYAGGSSRGAIGQVTKLLSGRKRYLDDVILRWWVRGLRLIVA